MGKRSNTESGDGNVTDLSPFKKKPKNVTKDRPHESKELTEGSMVEVELDGIQTGVIRWIGHNPDDPESPTLLAGLEMDTETIQRKGESCGKINGIQIFSCEPGKGLFIPLDKCKHDRRFLVHTADKKNVETETVVEACSSQTRECLSCGDAYSQDELHTLTYCECLSCTECFHNAFQYLIKERDVLEWTCQFCKKPDLAVKENRDGHFSFLNLKLQQHLENEPELFQLFTKKLNQWKMQDTPNFVWCANDKCHNGFIPAEGNTKTQCPHCNMYMCCHCKIKWPEEHTNRTCQEYKSFQKAIEAPSTSKKHVKEELIACPECKFTFELARGGCMHFKCSQCPHEFCGGCMRQFKTGSSKGLHCQHPRDCFYYLRDCESYFLEDMLKLHNIANENPEISVSDGTCPLNVTEDITVDESYRDKPCGAEIYKAGLCHIHYKEHLVKIINKHRLDPVDQMDKDDVIKVLKRENIPYQETASNSSLRQLVKDQLPLQVRPYQ